MTGDGRTYERGGEGTGPVGASAPGHVPARASTKRRRARLVAAPPSRTAVRPLLGRPLAPGGLQRHGPAENGPGAGIPKYPPPAPGAGVMPADASRSTSRPTRSRRVACRCIPRCSGHRRSNPPGRRDAPHPAARALASASAFVTPRSLDRSPAPAITSIVVVARQLPHLVSIDCHHRRLAPLSVGFKQRSRPSVAFGISTPVLRVWGWQGPRRAEAGCVSTFAPGPGSSQRGPPPREAARLARRTRPRPRAPEHGPELATDA